MDDNKRTQDLASFLSAMEGGRGPESGVIMKVGGKGNPGKGTDPTSSGPIILKDGTPLTRDMFESSAKNGMPFTDMKSMADWMNGWVKKTKDMKPVHPYYRTYPEGTISGADILILRHKYGDDPNVNKLLDSATGTDNEVPMYGPDQADQIRKLADHLKSDPVYKVTGQ
jgi:hypothetical protein